MDESSNALQTDIVNQWFHNKDFSICEDGIRFVQKTVARFPPTAEKDSVRQMRIVPLFQTKWLAELHLQGHH